MSPLVNANDKGERLDSGHRKKRVDLLIQLAKEIERNEPKQAYAYCLEAIALSEDLGYLEGACQASFVIGYPCVYLGKSFEAIQHAHFSIGIGEELGDIEMINRPRMVLGMAYRQIGRYEEALQQFFSLLDYYESVNKWRLVVDVYNNVSDVFDALHDYKQGLSYINRVLDSNRDYGEGLYRLGVSCNVAVRLNIKLGYFESAKGYLDIVMRLVKEGHLDRYTTGLTYNSASMLAFRRGDYEAAYRFSESALACQYQLGSQVGVAEESINLGRVLLHLDEVDRAEELLEHGVSIAKSLKILPLEMDATKVLANLYETTGQMPKSVQSYKRLLALHATVFDTRLTNRFSKAQMQHQLAAKACETEAYRIRVDQLESLVEQKAKELRDSLDSQQALQFQLTESLDRLREAIDFKSSIIEGVAHEFRTPLTVIKTSLDFITEFRNDLTPDRERMLVARIGYAINRINRTISDVQTVNKLDLLTVDYAPEQFDLLTVFQKLFIEFGAENDRLWLERDISAEMLQVSLNSEFIRAILIRLVENALQFSPKDTRVTLYITSKNNMIHIQIKDHGIGIPADEHNDIFKSFYRASNAGTKAGLGLGLTIAQSYTHAMSGKISILQTNPTGTTIQLTLPRTYQPQ